MKELLKTVVRLEKVYKELMEEEKKIFRPFYSGYLRALGDVKRLILESEGVIDYQKEREKEKGLWK